MPVSQNGYSADDPSQIASYSIPYSSERIALRKGSAGVVLLHMLGFIRVEVVNFDTNPLDEWGYAERTIRGDATTLSNHASGTAFDVDATRHPLGETGTWSAHEVSLIENMLATLEKAAGEQVLRWGRDYHGRKDEMHIEIVAGAAAVIRCADAIRAGTLPNGAYSYVVGRPRFRHTNPPPPAPPGGVTLNVGDKGHEVGKLQQELRDFMSRHRTSYNSPPIGPLAIDNDYGPTTSRFVSHAKAMLHYQVKNQQGNFASPDFRNNLLHG